MIKIITDSAAYIPSDLLVEYNITALPLSIIMDGREIWESEISNDTFYEMVRKQGKTPGIKAVSTDDLEKTFEAEVSQGKAIIGIFMSAKVNDTYNNAVIAKERLFKRYPNVNITVIDSQFSCMAEGMAVLAAARKANEGAWLEDAVDAAKECLKRTMFMFIPHTMKYMEMSGKLSKAQAIMSDALQITPVLQGKAGIVTVRDKVITKNRAVHKILEVFKKDVALFGIRKVYVHHIDAIDKAAELSREIGEIVDVEVTIADIGPAIGANFGPGLLGMVYSTEEPLPHAE